MRGKGSAVMEKLLSCTISPGQFTGEFAVQGKLFDERAFSLFALREHLEFDEEPTRDKHVEGWIRVVPLDQRDDLLLVALPRTTFENGRAITVKANEVR